MGKLDWRSPDSSLHACWWVTNAHSAPQEPVRLLVKSLAVLRAELHRTRVATLSSVSAERQRRAVQNSRVRAILESNPQWRAAAGPVQQRLLMGTMSTGAKESLQDWSQKLCTETKQFLESVGVTNSEDVLPARKELSEGVAA